MLLQNVKITIDGKVVEINGGVDVEYNNSEFEEKMSPDQLMRSFLESCNCSGHAVDGAVEILEKMMFHKHIIEKQIALVIAGHITENNGKIFVHDLTKQIIEIIERNS